MSNTIRGIKDNDEALNSTMRKYIIQLEASQHRVWINCLDSSQRYVLPQDEYIRRYKLENERTGTHEVIATNFEWGYEGRGPALLARAIADEVLDDNATTEQISIIMDKVMRTQHGEDSEFVLEF